LASNYSSSKKKKLALFPVFPCCPGAPPASSTTKTGRHDIAEILLKVVLKHQKSNQNQSRIAKKNKKNALFFSITNYIMWL
jgi:hypothetical protein